MGGFLILGLIIALFSTKEYTSKATLKPEGPSGQGAASGLLKKYGGMLGLSGAGLGNSKKGTIPPKLYPKIVQSLPYQIKLMQTPVHFSDYDTTATVYEFYNNIYDPSLLSYVKGYTIGLPGKVIGLFGNEQQNKQPSLKKAEADSIISITGKQMGIIGKFQSRLTISVDEETGLLTLTGELPDPQASAEVTQAAIRLLKEEVKKHRTKKAKRNLTFTKNQVKKAKNRFQNAQNNLAEFQDSHRNLRTAKAKSREKELQSQYDLTYDLYNSLSQQLEQTKLELQKTTPVFSVLQPVSVPLNDNTSGLLVLIVSGVLGGIIGLGWVLVSNWWDHE